MHSRIPLASVLSLAWGLAASAAPGAPFPAPFGAPRAETPVMALQRDGGGDTERRSDAGPYVLLGGGLDGYTGGLGSALNLGPAAGGLLGVKDRMLGLEVGYTTSGVDVDLGAGGAGPGMDVVRQSGHLAATLGLLDETVQPFVLGGVGLDSYNVRNGEELGYRDSTSFAVPVGGGLRYNITRLLTADARVTYNFLVNDAFAPGDPGGNRYTGLLTFGGTY